LHDRVHHVNVVDLVMPVVVLTLKAARVLLTACGIAALTTSAKTQCGACFSSSGLVIGRVGRKTSQIRSDTHAAHLRGEALGILNPSQPATVGGVEVHDRIGL